MLIFNNNKPIKQKQWINTKVEFEWSEELQKYVEQSAEGYWYDGEMALCYTHDHAVTISGNTAIGMNDTQHAALNVSAPSSTSALRLGNSSDSSDDINIYLRSSGLIYFSTAGDGDICLGGGGDPSSFNIYRNEGVGIGTASPSTKLTIEQDDNNRGVGDGYGQFHIRGATDTNKRLSFGVDTDTTGATMCGWIIAGHNTVANSNLSLQPEGGNVGIGTVVPTSNLHVYGATVSYLQIETGDGDYNPIVRSKNPDRIWDFGTFGGLNDYFSIRDTTDSVTSYRLTIDTSGNVEFPAANAKISGSSTSTGSFGRVEATRLSGDGTDITGLSSFAGAAGTEALISGSSTSTGSFGSVHTAGYVGIGTASPTVPLTSTNTNATGVAFSLPHFTVQQKNYDWSGEPAGDGEWSDSDYKSIQAWNEYNGGFFTLYTKSGGGGTRSYGRSVQPFVMSGGGDNALSYTAWNATGFTQAKSGASPDPNWRLSGGYLQGRPAEHDWGSASGEATWYITCWGKCGTFQ